MGVKIERTEIRIPLYSIYRMENDEIDLARSRGFNITVIKYGEEYSFVQETIGEIIIRKTEVEGVLEILYTSSHTPHKKVPMLLGNILLHELKYSTLFPW